jgi:hypothetical protein
MVKIESCPSDSARAQPSSAGPQDARGQMDRTMVTAVYVILLIGLIAGAGWGLWQLLAGFNREIDE